MTRHSYGGRTVHIHRNLDPDAAATLYQQLFCVLSSFAFSSVTQGIWCAARVDWMETVSRCVAQKFQKTVIPTYALPCCGYGDASFVKEKKCSAIELPIGL